MQSKQTNKNYPTSPSVCLAEHSDFLMLSPVSDPSDSHSATLPSFVLRGGTLKEAVKKGYFNWDHFSAPIPQLPFLAVSLGSLTQKYAAAT